MKRDREVPDEVVSVNGNQKARAAVALRNVLRHSCVQPSDAISSVANGDLLNGIASVVEGDEVATCAVTVAQRAGICGEEEDWCVVRGRLKDCAER